MGCDCGLVAVRRDDELHWENVDLMSKEGSLPMQTNFNTYSDVNEDGCVTVVKKKRRGR